LCFGTFVFSPSPDRIVVLYLHKLRRHFGFVCRVSSLTSGREYVLEVNEVAGDFGGVCGGRDEGRYLTFVTLLFF